MGRNMHDLVIASATIFDGTGAPGVVADLAVTDGVITAIGNNLGAARESIDASGLALAPGIIDGHTHYDAQITWDPMVDPSPSLGVTTVVIGNCGFTIAPCRPEDRDLTMRNLTHVEGMSLEALRAGIKWDFESFPDYMNMLERQGVGPNVAAFVGHSSVRTYVLGDGAAKREATDEEIVRMQAIVREAMAAGAVGFASSTNEPHNGENGIPMPSRLADDREMRGLVTAMGESGRGLFMLTKGAKTSVPYLETLAADSGRPVLIAAMLHNSTNPNRVFDAIEEMKQARSRNNRLIAQVACTPLTMDFTLHSPYVFEGIDSWKPAMEAHGDAVKAVYADKGFRERVKADLVTLRGMRLFNSEWDKLNVVETAKEENRWQEGKTLEALAGAAGVHPLDYLLDLSLSENLDTLFTAVLLNTDKTAVGKLVSDPENHVALSDAGAHLTFLCDAGFGLHLMGHWARDQHALSLPEAIRKLTSQTADLFGITDRGRLKPGQAADMILFDPNTVGSGPRERVHDLPTGAPRLTVKPVGLHGVWVNGKRIADETGVVANPARAGKLLRSFAAQ